MPDPMSFGAFLRRLLPSRVVDTLRDLLWRSLDIKWTLRSKLSIELHGLSDWVVFSDIFVNGEYDEAIEHTFSTMPSGEQVRILDLGANVGFFTLRCFEVVNFRNLRMPRQTSAFSAAFNGGRC